MHSSARFRHAILSAHAFVVIVGKSDNNLAFMLGHKLAARPGRMPAGGGSPIVTMLSRVHRNKGEA